MPKVTVNVSDKELDAETRKEIIRLRGQVVRLKAGNAKLKSQISQQQQTVQRARDVISQATVIYEAYKEEFDDSI